VSIYQKVCPACAASIPRESENCDCGYSFITSGETESSQDEELYLNYLNARIDQLVANVELARASLAERPSSFERALAVMRAVSALRTARDDIAAQEQKVHAFDTDSTERPAESDAVAEPHDASATEHADASVSVFGEQSLDSVRSHAPGTAFRALQAAHAAKVVSTQNRACPNCHAPNPLDATRCGCGFELVPVALPDVGATGDARPSRK